MSVLSCRSLVSHLIFSLCILQAQCMLHRQEKKVVVPMHVKIILIVWIFRMGMNAARLRTMIGTRPVQDHEGTDGCTTHWPIGTKRPKKPGWNIETFIKCHWTKNAIILFQPNVFIKKKLKRKTLDIRKLGAKHQGATAPATHKIYQIGK